ncbi:hypothetical protein FRB96_008188 [Tulasnella sp. 330]|nr:hypothetical protein FRB96_008188 [Tulasnella sp. 330]KAG8876074.1 hypothetical protein FRB97_004462 [Tulasnella sp. 331]KAG8887245.1 hypothetical protein FRB98_000342 [Tulasnella sp. 332]
MLPHTPMQALSVQSFHNDSPPFMGSNDRYLEPVPPFSLEGSRLASSAVDQLHPASKQAPGFAHALSSTPRTFQLPHLPLDDANVPQADRAAPPPPAAPASRPVSPEQSVSGISCSADDSIGPVGTMSAYTDLDRPSRIASPIDLNHEAESYTFPKDRLSNGMQDESKIPIVIVACGSFSPPTYLHLRMFEMAKDTVEAEGKYEILGGYYSPVSDHYKKAGLAPAVHRVRMCELSVHQTSSWLMVDPWEAAQPAYVRTAVVLNHFDDHINAEGGVELQDGSRHKIRVFLLAGGDLIESFGEPGVWSEPDLHIILGKFGCLIVERTGSDVWAFLLSHDILYQHRRNIIVVKQLIYNDISSTKVRLFVKRGMSIKFLLPNSVIQYIYDHGLYRDAKNREPPLKDGMTSTG